MSWTDGDDRIEVELKRSLQRRAEVELPAAQKTIREQAAQLEHLEQVAASRQAEIDRLRALLKRWKAISPDLAVESSEFQHIWFRSKRLNDLINATTEALK